MGNYPIIARYTPPFPLSVRVCDIQIIDPKLGNPFVIAAVCSGIHIYKYSKGGLNYKHDKINSKYYISTVENIFITNDTQYNISGYI